MGQVLGPTKLSRAFLATYGNVCNAATNTLKFQMVNGCQQTTNGVAVNKWQNTHGFTAMFVVLDQVGFQMAANRW